jgi:predicted polyphosphate/ATP-dependent NAD kinase
MSTVGIIANPSSGKDIRRLVAIGSVVDNNEKINIVRRVLAGLQAAGVSRVVHMPDHFGIVRRAASATKGSLTVHALEMAMYGTAVDSRRAAAAMTESGVACIVTLGGDGTNRAVAGGSGNTPLVAISTGTNNVFPAQVEGTLAGLAAGLLATGRVTGGAGVSRAKRLIVSVDGGPPDYALVDVALVRDAFVGARAVWRPDLVRDLFLAIAEPGSVGLSSIGAHLHPISRTSPDALHLVLAQPGADDSSLRHVLAPIAPGLVVSAAVASSEIMRPDEPVLAQPIDGVLALDGEREFTVRQGQQVQVTLRLDGPMVVDVLAVLRQAAASGALVDWP